MQERLKKEEEERQARRKRVEAIMKRTRNNPANNISKVRKTNFIIKQLSLRRNPNAAEPETFRTLQADCEKGEEDGAEHEKDESKGNIEAFLNSERMSADRSLTNGQSSNEHHKENLDNNK